MISGQELQQYQTLIDQVELAFRDAHPACSTPIREWRGKEIFDFQEDLLEKVQGRISEKWFYTHIRQQQDKPPRIDILHLLSRYAGYEDWQAFCYAQQDEPVPSEKLDTEIRESSAPNDLPIISSRKLSWKPVVAVLVLSCVTILAVLAVNRKPDTYTFCFLDADTRQLPAQGGIEITLQEEGESPRMIKADELGCFNVASTKEMVRFVVTAPYYLTDTIERKLNKEKKQEEILLKADDYALMLHYFSTSKVDDWKKRRTQLDEMISPNVRIIQVSGENGLGVEMYDKDEFINRMTLPVKSLKNMEIVQTEYESGKIVMLRFMLTENR